MKITFIVLLICSILAGCNQQQVSKGKDSESKQYFDKAKNYYDSGEYGMAQFYFTKVTEKDATYIEAQRLIKECETHLTPEELKKIKIKSENANDKARLERKYNSLISEAGSSSVYIARKLNDFGFKELSYSSEESIYTKTEEGYFIKVKVQGSSFSVSVQ